MASRSSALTCSRVFGASACAAEASAASASSEMVVRANVMSIPFRRSVGWEDRPAGFAGPGPRQQDRRKPPDIPGVAAGRSPTRDFDRFGNTEHDTSRAAATGWMTGRTSALLLEVGDQIGARLRIVDFEEHLGAWDERARIDEP